MEYVVTSPREVEYVDPTVPRQQSAPRYTVRTMPAVQLAPQTEQPRTIQVAGQPQPMLQMVSPVQSPTSPTRKRDMVRQKVQVVRQELRAVQADVKQGVRAVKEEVKQGVTDVQQGVKEGVKPLLEGDLAERIWRSGRVMKLKATNQELFSAYISKAEIWGRKSCAALTCSVCLLFACLIFLLARSVWTQSQPDTRTVTQEIMRYQEQAADLSEPFDAGAGGDFQPLGCYPLLPGDSTAAPALRDSTCYQTVNGQELCRSGLPFYRFVLQEGQVVSWRLCARLCLMKGLDISGVVDATECRCGASDGNADVWDNLKTNVTRPDLHWQPASNAVSAASASCRIVANRYTGTVPIESAHTDLTEKDLTYIKSVVLGVMLDAFEETDHKPVESSVQSGEFVFQTEAANEKASNSTSSSGRVVARDQRLKACYPHKCAEGWPWPIWTTYASGIPFAFDSSVLDSTKKVFLEAVSDMSAATCIHFVEVSPSYTQKYKIMVTNNDYCSAYPSGYPGLWRHDSEVTLGGCKSQAEKGSMVHELGHVLGMAHEMVRPDRDAYVTVTWSSIGPDWHAQYDKALQAYTGSRTEGHSPYDYDSLMHYPSLPGGFHTKPTAGAKGVHDSRIGQRKALSPLDIIQLRDMYGCEASPTPPCEDVEEGAAMLQINGIPQTCSGLASKCSDPTVKYFCGKTCGLCPTEQALAYQKPLVQGCADATGSVCDLLIDYCPGHDGKSLSGHEQYMFSHCRKTCHITEFCGPAPPPSARVASSGATAGTKPSSSVSMLITFELSQQGQAASTSDGELMADLRVRFYTIFRGDAYVELLNSPQCGSAQRCTGGEARLYVACGGSGGQSCSDLKMAMVNMDAAKLTSELADAGSASGIIRIDSMDAEIPFDFESLPALAVKYWIYMVIVTSVLGCAIACAFAACFRRMWWSNLEERASEEKDMEAPPPRKTRGITLEVEKDDSERRTRGITLEVEEDDEDDEDIAEGAVWSGISGRSMNSLKTEMSQETLDHIVEENIGREELFEEYGGLTERGSKRELCIIFTAVIVAIVAGFFIVNAAVGAAEQKPVSDTEATPLPPTFEIEATFEPLNCYPLLSGDGVGTGTPALYDTECMASTQSNCRSGLPFYRFTLREIADSGGSETPSVPWRTCARFCLMKGLDISGVVDAVECRCGASDAHADFWRGASSPARKPVLSWQNASNERMPTSPECRIVAARYVGKLPLGPYSESDLQDEDLVYVASLLRGEAIPVEDVDLTSPGRRLQASSTELRSCKSPSLCSAGKAWPVGAQGIRFSFAPGVAEETKAIFRQALKWVSQTTCITFSEVPDDVSLARIVVTSNSSSCSAHSIGYSGNAVTLELGWCNTQRNLGAILHELGHVLGMANEETRPDRDTYVQVTGKLPVAEGVNPDAYVGSAEFGSAPYDYSSLMHGRPSKELQSLPEASSAQLGIHDVLMGQRNGFSPLDILQLRGMYQCGSGSSSPTQMCGPDIGPTALCRALSSSCPGVNKNATRSGVDSWLAHNCQLTCAASNSSCALSPLLKELSFSFVLPGAAFDLHSSNDRVALGRGLQSAMPELGAVESSQVAPAGHCTSEKPCNAGSASLSVRCDCVSVKGKRCVPCSLLEAKLSESTPETLNGWLATAGLTEVRVTEVAKYKTLSADGFFSQLFQSKQVLLVAILLGSAAAAGTFSFATWLLWWHAPIEVKLEIAPESVKSLLEDTKIVSKLSSSRLVAGTRN